MKYPGIHNENEFFPQHYLDAVLDTDVKEVKRQWKDEGRDASKVFRGLARDWNTINNLFYRVGAGEEDYAAIYPDYLAWHDKLLSQLGYTLNPSLVSTGDRLVPVLADEFRDNERALVVLETRRTLDDEAASPFEDHVLARDETIGTFDDDDAVETLADLTLEDALHALFFESEEPPERIIALCGDQLILFDRDKFGSGKHFRVQLNTLFERDVREVMTLGALLLHRRGLLPETGESLLDELDVKAHKHAFGVSTDLKDSARDAIELLGNEAIRYRMEIRKERTTSQEELAEQLTRDCLRYFYRLIFLFYAESRAAEFSIVPMDSEAWRAGYTMESLRDIEMVELRTEDMKNGFFFHETLNHIFELLNEGWPEAVPSEQRRIYSPAFELAPLHSDLFEDSTFEVLGGVKFRNEILQDIVRKLSLTRPKRGRSQGRISYSELGINQLGAVYEGLMAYSGFFASEDLIELRKASEMDDPEARTFFVPLTEKDAYKPKEIVKDETGSPKIHRKNEFVFRLAGRDREKSASYYTPEVLTDCLVENTLKVRLGEPLMEGVEPDHPPISADEMLGLTILEPAMGSGAFLNEAVDQLAEKYLEKKQQELGETIPQTDYAEEKQRVKHYLVANNVYGVDLNPMATELGKVSLWLGTLHSAFDEVDESGKAKAVSYAPWFDARLKWGNSLIGARLEGWGVKKLQGRTQKLRWWNFAPTKREDAVEGDFVYHFLLPDEAMLGWKDDKVVKKRFGQERDIASDWRSEHIDKWNDLEIAQLLELTTEVDELLEQHRQDRRSVMERTHQVVPVWGRDAGDEEPLTIAECRRRAESLDAPHGAYRRLKDAMDYGTAFWSWPLDAVDVLPSRAEWLEELGVLLTGSESEREVLLDSKRLQVVAEVTERVRPFHWPIEFSEVLLDRGGFDLVLGNPPWVQPNWNDQNFFAEWEPKVYLRGWSATKTRKDGPRILENSEAEISFRKEIAEGTGVANFIGAVANYPLLQGVRNNLYKCFITQTEHWLSEAGVSGLLHPTGAFDDARGQELRKFMYPRLRATIVFVNELLLFSEVTNHTNYAIHVQAHARAESRTNFVALFNSKHPTTWERSLSHAAKGEVPGMKNDAGDWELRGHRNRIVYINDEVLEIVRDVFEEDAEDPRTVKLPAIHSTEILDVLTKLRASDQRVGDILGDWKATDCFNETTQQDDGTIVRETRFPAGPEEFVFSGPHIFVGNPLYKTPREDCSHNKDYDNLDLTEIPDDYLPRTNYVPDVGPEEFRTRTPQWKGRPMSDWYRLAHRKLVSLTGERTFTPAIFPTGTTHIDNFVSFVAHSDHNMVLVVGVASSLVIDFLVRITGMQNVRASQSSDLPVGKIAQLRY